eukprot:TRINITY_DN15366_c1_g1_i1.p1 TRINITY_DN15366_c1_g1~~TRINITY_DN15366_c1_g1_i1.p1  ORF type:complete len:3775 (+),score=1043.04 TRINITY_DN15366_c1_g1_i1:134-11458(+)
MLAVYVGAVCAAAAPACERGSLYNVSEPGNELLEDDARHVEDAASCSQACADTPGCLCFAHDAESAHCTLFSSCRIPQPVNQSGVVSGPVGCWVGPSSRRETGCSFSSLALPEGAISTGAGCKSGSTVAPGGWCAFGKRSHACDVAVCRVGGRWSSRLVTCASSGCSYDLLRVPEGAAAEGEGCTRGGVVGRGSFCAFEKDKHVCDVAVCAADGSWASTSPRCTATQAKNVQREDCQAGVQYNSANTGNSNLESTHRLAGTADECADICADAAGCKCFTWNGKNDRCWLMSACGNPTPRPPEFRMVSGSPGCRVRNDADEHYANPKAGVQECRVTAVNLRRGMRVARGVDWKWGDDDSTSGIGTVMDDPADTEQCLGGYWARVAWPSGKSNNYRVGCDGKFDLALEGCLRQGCKLSEEAATPGTTVKRGPDWGWGDQDGKGAGVVRWRESDCAGGAWIRVRWDRTGIENNYRVGCGGRTDLAPASGCDASTVQGRGRGRGGMRWGGRGRGGGRGRTPPQLQRAQTFDCRKNATAGLGSRELYAVSGTEDLASCQTYCTDASGCLAVSFSGGRCSVLSQVVSAPGAGRLCVRQSAPTAAENGAAAAFRRVRADRRCGGDRAPLAVFDGATARSCLRYCVERADCVVAGFERQLSRCELSDADRCGSTVEHLGWEMHERDTEASRRASDLLAGVNCSRGLRFEGEELLGTAVVQDHFRCLTMCAETPECTATAYAQHKCSLLSSVRAGATVRDAEAISCTRGGASTSSIRQKYRCTTQAYFAGGDLMQLVDVESRSSCEDRCSNVPDCVAIVYRSGVCNLKAFVTHLELASFSDVDVCVRTPEEREDGDEGYECRSGTAMGGIDLLVMDDVDDVRKCQQFCASLPPRACVGVVHSRHKCVLKGTFGGFAESPGSTACTRPAAVTSKPEDTDADSLDNELELAVERREQRRAVATASGPTLVESSGDWDKYNMSDGSEYYWNRRTKVKTTERPLGFGYSCERDMNLPSGDLFRLVGVATARECEEVCEKVPYCVAYAHRGACPPGKGAGVARKPETIAKCRTCDIKGYAVANFVPDDAWRATVSCKKNNPTFGGVQARVRVILSVGFDCVNSQFPAMQLLQQLVAALPAAIRNRNGTNGLGLDSVRCCNPGPILQPAPKCYTVEVDAVESRRAVAAATNAVATEVIASFPCEPGSCQGDAEDVEKAINDAIANATNDTNDTLGQITDVDTDIDVDTPHDQPCDQLTESECGVTNVFCRWQEKNGTHGCYPDDCVADTDVDSSALLQTHVYSSLTDCKEYCALRTGCVAISYAPHKDGGLCKLFRSADDIVFSADSRVCLSASRAVVPTPEPTGLRVSFTMRLPMSVQEFEKIRAGFASYVATLLRSSGALGITADSINIDVTEAPLADRRVSRTLAAKASSVSLSIAADCADTASAINAARGAVSSRAALRAVREVQPRRYVCDSDITFAGEELKRLSATPATDCLRQCTGTAGCSKVVIEADGGCVLKTADAARVDSDSETVACEVDVTERPEVGDIEYECEAPRSYIGGDLLEADGVTSEEECRALCTHVSAECDLFVFDSTADVCVLKAAGEAAETDVGGVVGLACHAVRRASAAPVLSRFECKAGALVGGTLFAVEDVPSVSECQRSCAAVPQCTSLVHDTSRRCELKGEEAVLKPDPKGWNPGSIMCRRAGTTSHKEEDGFRCDVGWAYSGEEIRRVDGVPRAEVCLKGCAADPACGVVVYRAGSCTQLGFPSRSALDEGAVSCVRTAPTVELQSRTAHAIEATEKDQQYRGRDGNLWYMDFEHVLWIKGLTPEVFTGDAMPDVRSPQEPLLVTTRIAAIPGTITDPIPASWMDVTRALTYELQRVGSTFRTYLNPVLHAYNMDPLADNWGLRSEPEPNFFRRLPKVKVLLALEFAENADFSTLGRREKLADLLASVLGAAKSTDVEVVDIKKCQGAGTLSKADDTCEVLYKCNFQSMFYGCVEGDGSTFQAPEGRRGAALDAEQCGDADYTGFVVAGHPANCSELADLCDVSPDIARTVCPATCRTCTPVVHPQSRFTSRRLLSASSYIRVNATFEFKYSADLEWPLERRRAMHDAVASSLSALITDARSDGPLAAQLGLRDARVGLWVEPFRALSSEEALRKREDQGGDNGGKVDDLPPSDATEDNGAAVSSAAGSRRLLQVQVPSAAPHARNRGLKVWPKLAADLVGRQRHSHPLEDQAGGCVTGPQTQQYGLMSDTYDIKTVTGLTLQGCVDACQSTPSCAAFTRDKIGTASDSQPGDCTLKNMALSLAGDQEETGTLRTYIVSCPEVRPCVWVKLENVALHSSDQTTASRPMQTAQDCKDLCANLGECLGVSYQSSTGVCYFVHVSESARIGHDDYTSYVCRRADGHHTCTDGTHGCDSGEGSACYEVHRDGNSGHICGCRTGYHCVANCDKTQVAHQCSLDTCLYRMVGPDVEEGLKAIAAHESFPKLSFVTQEAIRTVLAATSDVEKCSDCDLVRAQLDKVRLNELTVGTGAVIKALASCNDTANSLPVEKALPAGLPTVAEAWTRAFARTINDYAHHLRSGYFIDTYDRVNAPWIEIVSVSQAVPSLTVPGDEVEVSLEFVPVQSRKHHEVVFELDNVQLDVLFSTPDGAASTPLESILEEIALTDGVPLSDIALLKSCIVNEKTGADTICFDSAGNVLDEPVEGEAEQTVCEMRVRKDLQETGGHTRESIAWFECQEGEMLEIIDAFWGRKTCAASLCYSEPAYYPIGEEDRVNCGETYCDSDTCSCFGVGTLATLQELCNGRTSCLVDASTEVLADPCPGENKYLWAKYVCASGDAGTSQKRRVRTLSDFFDRPSIECAATGTCGARLVVDVTLTHKSNLRLARLPDGTRRQFSPEQKLPSNYRVADTFSSSGALPEGVLEEVVDNNLIQEAMANGQHTFISEALEGRLKTRGQAIVDSSGLPGAHYRGSCHMATVGPDIDCTRGYCTSDTVSAAHHVKTACNGQPVCGPADCSNNGEPSGFQGSCTCVCKKGYTGRTCDTCKEGWEGYPACKDVRTAREILGDAGMEPETDSTAWVTHAVYFQLSFASSPAFIQQNWKDLYDAVIESAQVAGGALSVLLTWVCPSSVCTNGVCPGGRVSDWPRQERALCEVMQQLPEGSRRHAAVLSSTGSVVEVGVLFPQEQAEERKRMLKIALDQLAMRLTGSLGFDGAARVDPSARLAVNPEETNDSIVNHPLFWISGICVAAACVLGGCLFAWFMVKSQYGYTALDGPPPDYMTYAGDRLIIHRRADESLGVELDPHAVLVDVGVGSSAERCGAKKFVGRRVTHVNEIAIACVEDVYDLTTGAREIVLDFLPMTFDLDLLVARTAIVFDPDAATDILKERLTGVASAVEVMAVSANEDGESLTVKIRVCGDVRGVLSVLDTHCGIGGTFGKVLPLIDVRQAVDPFAFGTDPSKEVDDSGSDLEDDRGFDLWVMCQWCDLPLAEAAGPYGKHGAIVNGFPVWARFGGGWWLYSTPQGHWCLSQSQSDFLSGGGTAMSPLRHHGAPPDQSKVVWQTLDGMEVDITIAERRPRVHKFSVGEAVVCSGDITNGGTLIAELGDRGWVKGRALDRSAGVRVYFPSVGCDVDVFAEEIDHAQGPLVEVMSRGGEWREAIVTNADQRQLKVHYVGYNHSYDEWMDRSTEDIRRQGLCADPGAVVRLRSDYTGLAGSLRPGEQGAVVRDAGMEHRRPYQVRGPRGDTSWYSPEVLHLVADGESLSDTEVSSIAPSESASQQGRRAG